ncbi:MAG: hypothetical protein WAM14_10640 [Candidatus Nitrosopolaris sp.]
MCSAVVVVHSNDNRTYDSSVSECTHKGMAVRIRSRIVRWLDSKAIWMITPALTATQIRSSSLIMATTSNIVDLVIKTQPELKGEAGEANLLAILRNEFRQDLFTPQTRGISGADIIQQIRTPSGELLKITIGYYNKEANDANKSDIEKTKR